MFTSLKRIYKLGWLSFSRNSGLSVATVFIMVMTISLVTFLFFFQEITRFSASLLKEKADISVYFKKGTSEKEILELKERLFGIPEVKDIEYVSTQEAIERLLQRRPELKESVKEAEGFLELASLNIKARELDQLAAIVGFLENSSFKNLIENVNYYQRRPVIERIFSLASAISRAGLVLTLILAMVAILIIFNQVRLAIYHFREEIAIQRLVGASNWFIRGPFLVQGAIAGFLAAIITLLISSVALFFLSPKLEILIPGLNLFKYFLSNFFIIFLIQLLTGVGLAVISSLIAIRKYLEI